MYTQLLKLKKDRNFWSDALEVHDPNVKIDSYAVLLVFTHLISCFLVNSSHVLAFDCKHYNSLYGYSYNLHTKMFTIESGFEP